jgi:hypothetical protein
MDVGRLDQIGLELAARRTRGESIGAYLCDVCVDVTGMSGAGIMLMADGQHRGMVGASNSVARTVEELQFTTGEGPCVDACRDRRPALEPDLAQPVSPRWPAFSGPAVKAGVRSIFGIPLDNGGLCVGALDLYGDQPGGLTPHQLDDAVTLARVLADAVITMQADAAPGTVAPELQPALRYQAIVHQAAGMVSARLGLSLDDALVRLRAYAYARDQSIHEIARDIVNRSFDFDSATLT